MTLAVRLRERFAATEDQSACERAVLRHFPQVATGQHCVDVVELARNAGIHVTTADTVAFDGALNWDDKGAATITVAANANSKRQRFTVAHELGHWILQRELNSEPVGPLFRGVSENQSQVREEERLANLLAAELLMPSVSVRELLKNAGTDWSFIRQVAAIHNVSQMAAMRRIADLSGTALVYVSVVPQYFADSESIAELDDAIYFKPGTGTYMDRDGTKLVEPPTFESIRRGLKCHLALRGRFGLIHAVFDVLVRRMPFVNCGLLASGSPI